MQLRCPCTRINMCEVLDRYWNSGITTGRQKGVTSTQTLFYRLIKENRMDDLRRASSDRNIFNNCSKRMDCCQVRSKAVLNKKWRDSLPAVIS